jgi:hypothetical protein
VLVEVSVAVLGRDVLTHNVWMQFYHGRRQGANGGYVAAFFTALGVGEDGGWEEGCYGGRAEEDAAAGAEGGVQVSSILAMGRG